MTLDFMFKLVMRPQVTSRNNLELCI
ncbi:unnamed protein product [Discula destructiva]